MRVPLETRFWSKVDKSGDCWLWMASTKDTGYGQFFVNGTMVRAHRLAYELMVGPVPDGLQLDHLCRVRNCVNPEHLEPVTTQENTRRGASGHERRQKKTHCAQGHPYNAENTYLYRDMRYCRACRRARDRESPRQPWLKRVQLEATGTL